MKFEIRKLRHSEVFEVRTLTNTKTYLHLEQRTIVFVAKDIGHILKISGTSFVFYEGKIAWLYDSWIDAHTDEL